MNEYLKRFIKFNNIKSFVFIFIIFNIIVHSQSLSAQYFLGPVARGFGGAGVAGTESPEALFINPAALSHGRALDLSLFYESKEKYEGKDSSSYGFSIVDNTDKILFSGGVGYLKNKVAYPLRSYINETFLIVGGALSLSDNVSVGLSLSKLDKSLPDKEYTHWNTALGFQHIVHQKFLWGMSFQNLLPEDDDTPLDLQEVMNISLGGQWFYHEKLSFRLDIKKDLEDRYSSSSEKNKQFQYLAGIESKPLEFFAFRFGYRINSQDRVDYGALGLSFNGPRLKIDYTVDVGVRNEHGQIHSIDMRLPIW